MDQIDFKARVDELKRCTSGRWTEVLRLLGVDEKILRKRNLPCPSCGGKDRFQYTDKFSHGDYHCRGCGHGDGFNLLMHFHGWDFATAFKQVESIVGSISPTTQSRLSEPSSERMKAL